ncbi:MAG: thermonuclease family protein [Myxococcota bacterium]
MRLRFRSRGRLGPLALALGLLAAACAPRSQGRYDREQLRTRLTAADTSPGLVVGEFLLASPAVVDGDTIKVVGIDGTLRLLAIDTEETFKSDKDRRAYDQGFEAYLANKQAGHDRPIKAATPLGMDAKHWAEEFLDGVRTVRLERDHPKELRGRYGRLLTYVMVERDGRWLNYNVECVRAGMSPYFTKYGYSRRFHDQFVQAQQEARAAGRGIWDPAKEHYDDYDRRLTWWNARAEVIADFEQQAQTQDHFIALTNWDAMERLEALEGEEVVLLATVGEIRPRQGNRPARVLLSRRMFSDLPLIFFEDDVLTRSDIEEARGEYVQVRGTVSRYVFRQKRKRSRKDEPPRSQLQVRIRKPEQISFVDTRPAHRAPNAEPVAATEPETPPADDRPAPAHEDPAPPTEPPAPGPVPDDTPEPASLPAPPAPAPPASPDSDPGL